MVREYEGVGHAASVEATSQHLFVQIVYRVCMGQRNEAVTQDIAGSCEGGGQKWHPQASGGRRTGRGLPARPARGPRLLRSPLQGSWCGGPTVIGVGGGDGDGEVDIVG